MILYKLRMVVVKKLLGVADIAGICGVEPKTVSIWRLRYADFPEPDVTVGETAGWDPGRTEEIRAWMGRRPGRGRKAPPAPYVQEALRRVFVYSFMRPDDFAWAPIDFPGARYDDDGVLADGMQAWAHVDSTLRDMAAANTVNSILQRQANAMDAILASFEQPRPAVLLPDFSGDDYSALEDAVLALVPTNPEQLADIEQVLEAASANPGPRASTARNARTAGTRRR
jgi:hypothetical protein